MTVSSSRGREGEESLHILGELARSHGVQRSYTDVEGRRRRASPEVILAVLRGLGVPVDRAADLRGAMAEQRRTRWRRALEPVTVAWEGRPVSVVVRLPSSESTNRLACDIELESGERRRLAFRPRDLPLIERAQVGRRTFSARRLVLPGPWPTGYHRIAVDRRGRRSQGWLFHAPTTAWSGSPATSRRDWGVFAPLYALRSRTGWGVGDLRDLGAVSSWVAKLGGAAVSTLPLLASFLDEPLEPSPYAPVSRRFWNELYLDVAAVPELRGSSRARRMIESPGFKAETRRLRATPQVDHRAAMAVKRRVLQVLCAELHGVASGRLGAFERYVAGREGLEDYARFRATVERRGAPWGAWPARLRDGELRSGDGDDRVARYHRYVQWLMSEQLGKLADSAGAGGPALALDLPLGVHPDGFDAWRERAIFVDGVSAGAPPDGFFPLGQDWGFRPAHPERSREQGHGYFIDSVRNHLQFAGVLRIDHVMSLHRLYWVPRGFAADEGAYVRYPAEELYAVICIESRRHRSRIVGEDLGTVPAYVRSAMNRHGVERLYALQAALPTRAGRRTAAVPQSAVASLNTHDMPTFAGFWNGLDIDERAELGLLDRSRMGPEHARRARQRETLLRDLRRRGHVTGDHPGARTILRGSLDSLASTAAGTVLVSLEDLWLERRPQNVPGTTTERANWCHKAKETVETIRHDPGIRRTLRGVDRRRRRSK